MATVVQTRYNVGGILLDRPFKVRRLGHFGFNVDDPEKGRHFYADLLGFKISDAAGTPEAPRGYFMRHNTDHHTFVLFKKQPPGATGPGAGGPSGITINQITWQVGSLAEVGGAARYFAEKGIPI